MRTVILASMRTYARRYVAALLAVVIATGFIVAISALSAAARTGSMASVAQQYGGADLAISGSGDVDTVASSARAAAADPGVLAVATNWTAYVEAELPDGARDISLGSIATAPALRWQEPDAGRLPTSESEIAIASSQASRHDVSIGDTVTVDVPGGGRSLTVTGTVDAGTGPLASTGYLTEAAFGALDEVAYPLDVVVAVDDSADAVATRLQETIPTGSMLASGDDYRDELRLQATRGIDVLQKLIYVFAGIALFVGALVIANTFTILLAQRSRDLALLRCVGAVRAQVARAVVLEGAVLGAIGSVLGGVLGLGVALVAAAATSRWAPDIAMGNPSLSVMTVTIPVLLGVAVTMAGSYLPAQRAGAQSPLSALHPHDVVELRSRAGALRLTAAVVLLLIGSAGLVAGADRSLPVAMLGGMLSFVGILLLTPVLVPAAIRCAGPVVRRVGLAGRLAHLNSLRNPRRTAATSTALLIGVTLITAVVVGSASISDKVNGTLDVSNPVDLIVTAPSGTVPERVAREIGQVEGVAGSATLDGTRSRIGDQDVPVLGVDQSILDLVHGSPEFADLGPDQIVLPASLDLGPTAGSSDTVPVTIGGDTRTMRVSFASGLGDSALVTRATLESMSPGAPALQAVWVRADEAADPGNVTSDVTAIAETSGLDVIGGLPERAEILDVLAVIMSITVGLLAVAVLIALIGVGNTLSLSVLERGRENSLLRAMGLPRSGLRRMLAIEALLMAGVAAVLGVTLGTTYAWFGVQAASIDVFRTAPGITIPWGQIALILLVAALAGLAACVLPARRAAGVAPAAGLVAD